jgi:hypothetical protein
MNTLPTSSKSKKQQQAATTDATQRREHEIRRQNRTPQKVRSRGSADEAGPTRREQRPPCRLGVLQRPRPHPQGRENPPRRGHRPQNRKQQQATETDARDAAHEARDTERIRGGVRRIEPKKKGGVPRTSSQPRDNPAALKPQREGTEKRRRTTAARKRVEREAEAYQPLASRGWGLGECGQNGRGEEGNRECGVIGSHLSLRCSGESKAVVFLQSGAESPEQSRGACK